MVMKMCISEGVTMIQCRWKCYDLIFGFSVLNYPRIHSSLILLSLRLAELGSLEAFHYSNNNSKEISCSLCCTSSSSFSLFLSLSLCFSLSILPFFPSLSVHWSLSQARRRCKILRSFPSLVSIPTRSVTYSVCECVFECVSVCVCCFVPLSLCLCRVLSPLSSPPQVQKFGLFFSSRINS